MVKSGSDGSDYFLSLHEQKIGYDEGCWATFKVTRVGVSAERPHGFQYSLTLHEEGGERILGFDNSHSIDVGSGPAKKSRRPVAFDHIDRRGQRSVPYAFITPHALLEAFFLEVDEHLSKVRDGK